MTELQRWAKARRLVAWTHASRHASPNAGPPLLLSTMLKIDYGHDRAEAYYAAHPPRERWWL